MVIKVTRSDRQEQMRNIVRATWVMLDHRAVLRNKKDYAAFMIQELGFSHALAQAAIQDVKNAKRTGQRLRDYRKSEVIKYRWMHKQSDPRYVLAKKIDFELSRSMGSGKTGEVIDGIFAFVPKVELRLTKSKFSLDTILEVCEWLVLSGTNVCPPKETDNHWILELHFS